MPRYMVSMCCHSFVHFMAFITLFSMTLSSIKRGAGENQYPLIDVKQEAPIVSGCVEYSPPDIASVCFYASQREPQCRGSVLLRTLT